MMLEETDRLKALISVLVQQRNQLMDALTQASADVEIMRQQLNTLTAPDAEELED